MVQKNIHLRGRLRDKLMPKISIGSYRQNSFARCCILLQKGERGHWALHCIYSRARGVALDWRRRAWCLTDMGKRSRCNVWMRCNVHPWQCIDAMCGPGELVSHGRALFGKYTGLSYAWDSHIWERYPAAIGKRSWCNMNGASKSVRFCKNAKN